MNPIVQNLYMTIAQAVFSELPSSGWVSAKYVFRAIDRMSEEHGYYLKVDGTSSNTFVTDEPGEGSFKKLRTEMAQLHANGHAWYTATFTLTPDGKFKFDFDYDHLPAFDIMPEPDKWLDEFKAYPRPELQAQIQDWIAGRETYQNGGSERLVKRLKTLAAQ